MSLNISISQLLSDSLTNNFDHQNHLYPLLNDPFKPAFQAVTGQLQGGSSSSITATNTLALSSNAPGSIAVNEPWVMHPIASNLRGPNSISSADINGDGYLDYVTAYQFDQRYVISLHPGTSGNPKLPWQQIIAFQPNPLTATTGVNPENATFADVDGDGFLDIIGAQGWSDLAFFDGSQPGVRVIWGGGANSWTDGGVIPATQNRGHFHYVRSLDVNGDGLTDIVAGGRKEGDNGFYAGIIWLEAPTNSALRRDLSQWQVHAIAPNQFTGFGFEFADLDGDGDLDIVLANNDFNTPANQVGIFWYENPGAKSSQLRSPWIEHVIDKINENDPADPLRELYTKAQVAIGDLDGDGQAEIIAQTKTQFLIYDKPANPSNQWSLTTLTKAPELQWLGRAIELVDLDRDGDLDIAGMLVHDNQNLPADKAAVFWVENNGNNSLSNNFNHTHVIKWGSGTLMPITLPDFGEKWDQMQFVDVDGDGDLDIIADNEEWWVDNPAFRPFWLPASTPPEAVSVVWFENRIGETTPGFTKQANGSYRVEAENFSRLENPASGALIPPSNTLVIRASYAGFSGNGYLQDLTSLRFSSPKGAFNSLGAEYDINVQQGGTYYLWVRRYVPSDFGTWLGGDASNSAWFAVDGNLVGSSLLNPVFDNGGGTNLWRWVRSQPIVLDAGQHVITLRAREGGYAVDQLVLAPGGITPTA